MLSVAPALITTLAKQAWPQLIQWEIGLLWSQEAMEKPLESHCWGLDQLLGSSQVNWTSRFGFRSCPRETFFGRWRTNLFFEALGNYSGIATIYIIWVCTRSDALGLCQNSTRDLPSTASWFVHQSAWAVVSRGLFGVHLWTYKSFGVSSFSHVEWPEVMPRFETNPLRQSHLHYTRPPGTCSPPTERSRPASSYPGATSSSQQNLPVGSEWKGHGYPVYGNLNGKDHN